MLNTSSGDRLVADLRELLTGENGISQEVSKHSSVKDLLQKHLQTPLEDLLSRPRKEFRAQLVEIGFWFIAKDKEPSACQVEALSACAEAIEALHTGSLIVDDIQDNSSWRRGGPTLHLKYGLSRALNAGNWLYFFAFERLRKSNLPAEARLKLYETSEQVLMEAHCGQAVDISLRMDECDPTLIPELCRASLEMKSGALMGLALCYGAIVAGATEQELQQLRQMGRKLGLNLQMFDDVGNLRVEQLSPKDLEDLKLMRPSFVWWHLSLAMPHEIPSFVAAIAALPEAFELEAFLERTALKNSAKLAAIQFQKEELHPSTEAFKDTEAFKKLHALSERLIHAYN